MKQNPSENSQTDLPESGKTEKNSEGCPTPNQRFTYDVEALRLKTEDVYATPKGTKAPGVAVRKPDNQTYFRAHPSEQNRLDVNLIYIKLEGRWYLPVPAIVQKYFRWVTPWTLYHCIDPKGNNFLLPVRLIGLDGKNNSWWETDHALVQRAMDEWIVMTPNQELGMREAESQEGDLREPDWPDLMMADLLPIAFKHTTIENDDHSVLKRLRGLAP